MRSAIELGRMFVSEIMGMVFGKPAYLCNHGVDVSNPEYWECTYFTRAGRNYMHTEFGFRDFSDLL